MPQRKRPSLLAQKKVAVVVNPYSAQRKWERNPKLRQYLQRKFPGRVFDQTGDKAAMIEQVKRLSLENDVIIALGGDGTLADVMQGIYEAGRQKDVLLGIVPFGSGNAVRKSLLIPKALKKALKLLSRGEPRWIDLIDLGGRVASFLSIGATGKVTHRKSQNKIPGLVGHLLAASILLVQPRDPMEIELFDGLDDKSRPFDYKKLNLKLFDCIINKTNHFGYSWVIAPKARIDDGYLDVTLFDIRAYNYLLGFPLIYLGHYQKVLKHFKATRVIVRGKTLHIQYNGEILDKREELELRVMPKALRIIAPPLGVRSQHSTKVAESVDFAE
jgi:diacylglycerol kinase family enzyme